MLPSEEKLGEALSRIIEIAGYHLFLWDEGNPLYGKDLVFTDELSVNYDGCKLGFREVGNPDTLTPLNALEVLTKKYSEKKSPELLSGFRSKMKEYLVDYFNKEGREYAEESAEKELIRFSWQ